MLGGLMIVHKFPSRDVRPEGGLQASGMDLGLRYETLIRYDSRNWDRRPGQPRDMIRTSVRARSVGLVSVMLFMDRLRTLRFIKWRFQVLMDGYAIMIISGIYAIKEALRPWKRMILSFPL